jgi:hypothetical protein
MGLLDRVRSTVTSTVSKATTAASSAVSTAKKEVQSVATKADSYAGAIKDKVTGQGGSTSGKQWYSGVTDAFKNTEKSIQSVVGSTVSNVQNSVTSAGKSLVDAGAAVQDAGRAVVNTGRTLVKVGERSSRDIGHLALDAGRLVSEAGQIATDAGKAAYHAGNAALTGDPKELEAARTSITSARGNVRDARNALTDAGSQLSDLGKQGQRAANAVSDAVGALDTARSSLDNALHSVNGAIQTIASAPRDVMRGVEKAISTGGKEVREAIARDVPGGKSMLAGIDRYAGGAKTVLEGVLHGDPFRVAKGLSQEAQGIVEFGKGAWKAGAPAIDFAKKALVDYAQGFNVEKQIKDLKPGESYQMKVGGNVHVEVGGEAKGSLKVTANKDGTYTVNAGGAIGINGYLEAGGKIGPLKAGADASAHGLVGGNLTLKCNSAEEAQRAAKIFEKLAAASSPAGLIAAGGQPISKEDAAFLKTKTTGVELNGAIAADAAAALGIDKGPLRAGIGGKVGLSQTTSLRIELDNGKPTGITVKNEFAGELSANGGVSIGLPAKKPEAPKPGEKAPVIKPEKWVPELQGKVQGSVSVETRYDFPKGVSLSEFQNDPVGTLKKSSAEMNKTATSTATISIEGEGKAVLPGLNKQGTVAAEVKFTGKPSEIFNSTALSKALNGDFEGAGKAMGDTVTVEGSVRTVNVKRWGVDGLGVSVFGVGVEGTFAAEKRHPNEPVIEFKGTGTKVASQALQQTEDLRRRGLLRA